MCREESSFVGTRVMVVVRHFCIRTDAEGRCPDRAAEAGVVTGERNPEGVDFLSDGELFPLAPETVKAWL